MDPISQGVVGSILPQSLSNKNEIRKAAVIGFFTGIAADIDVLIRSNNDPLLSIDYHRGFTHSLLLIPIGGLVTAFLFWLIFKKKLKFKTVFFYAVLGYGTHCLLDACTNYGTELLWPFSQRKIAWNTIAVIDPVFTVVLIVFALTAFKKKSVLLARFGLIFCISYLMLGLYQKQRAEQYVLNLAALRGHDAERVLVHPTLGNIVLWRGIYENAGNFYVDGIRVGLGSFKIYEGSSVRKAIPEKDFPQLSRNSQAFKDIERFSRFTSGYIVDVNSNKVGDIRYSLLPNSTKPLWAIEVVEGRPDEHVKMISSFNAQGNDYNTFWNMLRGKDIN